MEHGVERFKLFHALWLPFYDQKGQSTLEILIALVVLTVALMSAVLVIFGGQSLSLDSAESNQALRLAQKNLESVVASARYNFNGLASSSSTESEFLEEITVTNISTSTKQVTSKVSWQTDPQRVQNVELATLVTNWYGIQSSGGDSGGGGVGGDWTNPQTLGSIDLGPGESATGLDVINGIIYMTAVASAQTKPDFFVVNATNGQAPYIVSNLDTGPGLNAIDAAGNYAYVANNKTTSQLQVIDISNGSAPFLVASYTLPGVSGSGGVGNTIFYSNNKIYIGTKTATGPEFHVIDVSNPIAPSEIGSFELGADVNSIYVSGNTAYLATSADNGELTILDVTNPASITEIGGFDAPGSYDGLSGYLVGTKYYLGRANGANDGFDILDVTNPAAVTSLGSINVGSDVTGIRVRDYLGFVGTSDTNSEFQVYNIANPAAIVKISSFNFPNIATAIDYESNLVYVSVRSNDALRIITSK